MLNNFHEIIRSEVEILLKRMRLEGFYYCRKVLYDPTTWDINNGYCEEWAEAVAQKIPQAEVVWLDQYDEELAHCAILHRGKYYDAECLEGVINWKDLPLVKNQNKSRAEVLEERQGHLVK